MDENQQSQPNNQQAPLPQTNNATPPADPPPPTSVHTNPQPTGNEPTAAAAGEPNADNAGKKNLPVYVIIGLLMVFLVVATIFIVINPLGTETEVAPLPSLLNDDKNAMEKEPPTESDLTLPTISDNTQLDIIEEELDGIEVSSPESELDALDEEASGL